MSDRRRRVRSRIARLDRLALTAVTRRRSPLADRVLTTLSGAADNGLLWVGIAAVLAATDRPRARTAATAGIAGLGIASTLVNGPLKFVWHRDRPPESNGRAPLLALPRTYSFPSGHAASAAAFATGVAAVLPSAGTVVAPLAAAVAYSRVHTGVHYPSDVVAGAVLGAGAGRVGARIAQRARPEPRADTSPMRTSVPSEVILVASSKAGSADGLAAALHQLDRRGLSVVRRLDIDELDSVRDRLRCGPPALVVAAGGDGTVGAVADAIVGGPSVLGVLPLGTSNNAARSLGIPVAPARAADVLVEGCLRAIDIGYARTTDGTQRHFVNAATAGLNVAFARVATRGSLRRRFRGLTYPVAAATAVRTYEPFDCVVEHDGRRELLRLVHLSASNATVFGGVLDMRVPGASITDGLLDVIAVARLSRPQLGLAVGDNVIGRHTPVRGVRAMQVRSLRISVPPGQPDQRLAADGEILGPLDAEIGVLAGALPVVTPR